MEESVLKKYLLWLGPIIIIVTFVSLAHFTWNTWADPVVDFGREVYVPWQLSQGAVLYKDIAYFNGPISPYFNALIFKIFGPSLRTLFITNLTLLAVFIVLVWNLLKSLANRLTAFIGIMVTLCIFSFGQALGISNYNFIAPYSHEITHGIILCVAMILLLQKWQAKMQDKWLIAAGFFAGLAFLTKPEIALSALVVGVCSIFLAYFVNKKAKSEILRYFGIFFGAALVPIVISALILSTQMPFVDAISGVLNPWTGLFQYKVSSLVFYQDKIGLNDPVGNIWTMVIETFKWILIFLPAFALSLISKYEDFISQNKSGKLFIKYSVLIAAVIYILLFYFITKDINWFEIARPLPFLLIAILIWLFVCLQNPNKRDYSLKMIPFVLFALFMISKIILNADLTDYGFTLALPATLVFIITFTYLIPNELEMHSMNKNILIATTSVILIFTCCVYIYITATHISQKKYIVGEGVNSFRADYRGAFVEAARKKILDLDNSTSTLAVLPEGVMLNFLTGEKNSTPYVTLMPPEMILFGENNILNSFEKNPPDKILLIHIDTSEYGYPFFGQEYYGVGIMDWIKSTYNPLGTFGDKPLVSGSTFGIEILQKKN